MNNFCALKLDQNNLSKRTGKITKHIAKMNNGLGGAKIDEILDRTHHANHDYEKQKDNIYLYIDEEICGEFDWENKCVKDKNFNSDKALKDYIKSTPYYHNKDAYGRMHKLADDNIVCREITFWFSPDQTERMKPYIEEWGNDNLEFVKKMYPHCKIVCAVIHMHETSPHMQLIIIPFDDKGKLNNYKYFYDDQDNPDRKSKKKATGKRTAQQLQTKYAELVGRNYGLERGVMGTEELVSYEESKAEVALKRAKEKLEQALLNERIAEDKADKKSEEIAVLDREIRTIKTEGAKKIEETKRETENLLLRQQEIIVQKNHKILADYLVEQKNKLLKEKKEIADKTNEEVEHYKMEKDLEVSRLKQAEDNRLSHELSEKRELNKMILDEYNKEASKELESYMIDKDIEVENAKKRIDKEVYENNKAVMEEAKIFEIVDRDYDNYIQRLGVQTDTSKEIYIADYERLLEENKKNYKKAHSLEIKLNAVFNVLENLGIHLPINNTITEWIDALKEQVKTRFKPIFDKGKEALGIKEADEFDAHKRPKPTRDINGLGRTR